MMVKGTTFGYEGIPNNYDENLFVQQLGSLSMPSDMDDYDGNVNNNAFRYDNVEESMGTGLADPVVDLDRMIAETSARWKCNVTAIVSKTVTANTTSVSTATIHSSGTNPTAATTGSESVTYYTNVNSTSSTGSPQPLPTPNISAPGLALESTNLSDPTSSTPVTQSLVGIHSTLRRPQIVSRQNSTGTHCSVMSVTPTMEHQVIEQQQAEIQALHAAIHAQQRQQQLQQSSMNGFNQNRSRVSNIPHIPQQHQQQQYSSNYARFVPGMSALNENSVTLVGQNDHNNFTIINYGNIQNSECVPFHPYTAEGKNDSAPFDHIEVRHHDPSFWQDDLTVWSGFNTVTGNPESPRSDEPSRPSFSTSPPDNPAVVDEDCGKSPTSPIPLQKRRPDAESATGASALNGIPVRVVQDMEVKLASGMTGVTKKALYSGTINAHTRLPEGQGTFVFKKTGDTYQGEVHNGKMHGAGTYTFGNRRSSKTSSRDSKQSNRPTSLKGSFEHNVFIG